MEEQSNQITLEHVPQQTNLVVMQQTQHMELMKIAVQSDTGIEKMEKLMVLQERWEAGNAKKAFNAAMSRFQSVLPVIDKLGVVDFTTGKGRTYYHYAKLEDIAKGIQPALKETGLSYRFKQSQENGKIAVTCIVTHQDGHSDTTEMASIPDTSGGKDALKSLASTVSYLRRYTLTGILGIVVGGEDDESPQSEGKEPEQQLNCYPDAEFKKNFPAWSKMITSGKKTVEELHKYLGKKNVVLSQEQYNKLQKVGK